MIFFSAEWNTYTLQPWLLVNSGLRDVNPNIQGYASQRVLEESHVYRMRSQEHADDIRIAFTRILRISKPVLRDAEYPLRAFQATFVLSLQPTFRQGVEKIAGTA